MGFPAKGNLKLQDIKGVYIKCIEELITLRLEDVNQIDAAFLNLKYHFLKTF